MVPSGSIPQAKPGIPEAGIPVRGSGGEKAKEEKARSCTIAHAPAVRIFYGRPHRPKASHFPLALYPIAWEEGIQREKGKIVFGRSRSGRRIYLYRLPCQ